MCLTEIWLSNYALPTFIATTPKTHYHVQYSRTTRAGGIAAVIHNSIILLKQIYLTINSI